MYYNNIKDNRISDLRYNIDKKVPNQLNLDPDQLLFLLIYITDLYNSLHFESIIISINVNAIKLDDAKHND